MVGGWGSNYNCNASTLNIALDLLKLLKEDLSKLAARNLHELMRCWENVHRVQIAEAHTRHKLYREETTGRGITIGRIFRKWMRTNGARCL